MTLRHLALMAHARSKQLWDHTIAIINCWSSEDISEKHPYAPQPEIIKLGPKESMAFLKRLYGHQ